MLTKHFQRILLNQEFRLKQLEAGANFPDFTGGEFLEVSHMPAMVHAVLVDHHTITARPWYSPHAEKIEWRR